MHHVGWKANYFKSNDVSMFGHCFGVSQFPQFYDRHENKYQILPRPHVGSYKGKKGNLIFERKTDCGFSKIS